MFKLNSYHYQTTTVSSNHHYVFDGSFTVITVTKTKLMLGNDRTQRSPLRLKPKTKWEKSSCSEFCLKLSIDFKITKSTITQPGLRLYLKPITCIKIQNHFPQPSNLQIITNHAPLLTPQKNTQPLIGTELRTGEGLNVGLMMILLGSTAQPKYVSCLSLFSIFTVLFF